MTPEESRDTVEPTASFSSAESDVSLDDTVAVKQQSYKEIAQYIED